MPRRDIYTIDEQLVSTGGMYLGTIFSVISTIAVISGVTPVFVFFMIPMIMFYMHEQAFFTVGKLLIRRRRSYQGRHAHLLGSNSNRFRIVN